MDDGSSSPLGFQIQTFIDDKDPLALQDHPGLIGLNEAFDSENDLDGSDEIPGATELVKYIRSVTRKPHGWFDNPCLDRNPFHFEPTNPELGPCPEIKSLFEGNYIIGPNVQPPQDPLIIFEKLFSEKLMDFICEKCNTNPQGPKFQKVRGYKKEEDLQKAELWRFIALVLLVGIHGKGDITQNWSRNWLLESPAFNAIMSSDRFNHIFTHLQLTELENVQNMADVKEFIDKINVNLDGLYNVDKELCLVDTFNMVERFHSYVHYLPGKVTPPFKMIGVQESKSGYISRLMMVDESKSPYYQTEDTDLLPSGQQTIHLLEPYLDKGHSVSLATEFVDPILFDRLVAHRTDCIGLPKSKFKELSGRALSEVIMLKKWNKGDLGMVVEQYKGKLSLFNFATAEPIKCMSSFGDTKLVDGLPHALGMYNDMNRYCSQPDYTKPERPIARRRVKNTQTKVFLHVLDICLISTFSILTKDYDTNPNQLYPPFLLNMVEKIMLKYPVDNNPPPPLSTGSLARLTARHVEVIKSSTRGRCIVCLEAGNKNKLTYVKCPKCKDYMCSVPCFGIYHTESDYALARKQIWLKEIKLGSDAYIPAFLMDLLENANRLKRKSKNQPADKEASKFKSDNGTVRKSKNSSRGEMKDASEGLEDLSGNLEDSIVCDDEAVACSSHSGNDSDIPNGENELIQGLSKEPKKRGRKPKVATEEQPSGEPKKRGRKPKVATEEQLSKEPKKRGRKPKVSVEEQPSEKPKRRSRNFKAVVEEQPSEEPKKRGRKPKAVVEQPSEKPKKRGRKSNIIIELPKKRGPKPNIDSTKSLVATKIIKKPVQKNINTVAQANKPTQGSDAIKENDQPQFSSLEQDQEESDNVKPAQEQDQSIFAEVTQKHTIAAEPIQEKSIDSESVQEQANQTQSTQEKNISTELTQELRIPVEPVKEQDVASESTQGQIISTELTQSQPTSLVQPSTES